MANDSRVVHIRTRVHGRVVIQESTAPTPAGWLVVFHGYGQGAEEVLGDVRAIPGSNAWHVASVQALHRFYARDQQRVVASWMTRQDRDLAIADNVEYVDRVVDTLRSSDASTLPSSPASQLVFLGFSQGVAMAYRAALLGKYRADGVIVLCGDVPPELLSVPALSWPRVLIGAGSNDPWYTPAKVDADVAALASLGVVPVVVRFTGAHEWTSELRSAAGEWLRDQIGI